MVPGPKVQIKHTCSDYKILSRPTADPSSSMSEQNPVAPAAPEADRQIVSFFTPKHTVPQISCHNCGQPMESNGLSLCNECIALTVDITKDLVRNGSIVFCKNCGRVQVPPNGWAYAERETRELLAICLRKLKLSDSKAKLVDAKFIWTEPHSRRTKLKITVQGEAAEFNNLIIQQSYEVEFHESTNQCPECAKSYTANTWQASVQVRQRVDHKKTFLYLEQLILKNRAHKDTMSIEESREGIDFFYASKTDAARMLDFLSTVVPIKYKRSEQFISEDTHTGSKSYKFTYSVEIAPVCREDLVVLPKQVARQHGNIPLLVLCYKVSKSLYFVDPNTLKTTIIPASDYWKRPFNSVANSRKLTEYIVMDIELTGQTMGKFALADVTVMRASDLGVNDTTFYLRTHLGAILHDGDSVMGYDLTSTNFNDDLWDQLKPEEIPDAILVKKVYPDKPKKSKRRLWRMAKEYNAETDLKQSTPGYSQDYQEFLAELEQDDELNEEVYFDPEEAEEQLAIDVSQLDLETSE